MLLLLVAADAQCSKLAVKGAASFAVILNRPAGVWGADCGANEKKISVVVSWSKEAPEADSKLTATDLCRYAVCVCVCVRLVVMMLSCIPIVLIRVRPRAQVGTGAQRKRRAGDSHDSRSGR